MSTISESDSILEELCSANGLNFNEIKTTPIRFNENVKRIEMFFSGFPIIMHLEKFPNLTILKVVAQELNQISGLETCLNLIELWICECKITKIEGLKNCRNLKKLFLYSNRLTKIHNLEQLNLDVLWLNDNKISTIEGLSHMSELVELNLAKNSIINIGNSLKSLRNLEILNLAANEIKKFEEINHLQLLPRLKHLSFRDPQYGQNPITSLCNYSLYIMYLLPGLTSLDTFPIGQKAVKELADSTINKKKLWYYMKLTTANRELDEMIERLEVVEENECGGLRAEMRSIECKIRDLKKYSFISSLREEAPGSKSPEPKESLLKPLTEKLNEIEKKIRSIEQQKERAVKQLTQSIDLKKHCIQVELENGGNIRFEYYLSNGNGPNANSVNETWYKSCHDLIVSRFCASDYVSKAINGIRVNKVIRVMNRALLAKYEEAFLADVDENEYINNKPSLRKKIDYLFYCWRPKLGSQTEEMFEIIKNGFRNCSEYKKNGYEEAIPFTNSMSISDFYRIESLKNTQKSKVNYNLAYKHGYALLCKVYINKFAQSISGPNSLEDYKVDKSVMVESYPDSFGVRRAFKLENMNISKANTNSLTMTQELFEAQRTCECKSKQTEYFLFKKELAVPEYIIQYEYNYKHHVEDPFEKELQNIRETKPHSDLKQHLEQQQELANKPENIDEIVSKEIDNQLSSASPDENDGEKRLINLIELNLHNVGLTSLDIEPLKNLKHVKKLILSFNRLKSLKEINNMNSLEYLDASYNQIETLNGFKGVSKISYLDLSNNLLCDIVPLCTTLKQFFPTLTYLDLKDNRIKQVEKLRSLVLYFLRSLAHYNKEKLSEDEKEFSDNKSRLNREAIKSNGHFIVSKPRSLRYYFVAELCNSEDFCFERTLGGGSGGETDFNMAENSMASFESDIDLIKDPNLFNKITTLNLDNQNLYRLSNIDFLINLKWASFNNNFITKLEGIEKCYKLEELSLENNLLQSFNGLENLEQLRKVNLSNNEISDDATKPQHWEPNLGRLVYLSVSKNRLTTLRFVLRLPALIELYASFNRVSNLREVFHLKPLNGLVILDLSSNPMCIQDTSGSKVTSFSSSSKYRLFVIYHLRALKSLDGYSIESGEMTEARDCFGGKLTADYVAEKLAGSHHHHQQQRLSDLRSLEFPSASIRLVELAPTPQLVAEQFENLRSLNLENNSLTSFSGIIYLKSLRLLSLNYNKIESIFPKSKSNPIPTSLPTTGFEAILPNLEVLHLGYNSISDLVNLQVGRLTSLKALFLQGNEITKIEGLESLRDLRELVLDKNKIKQIGELSFVGQSQRLVELHIEENRLRDLTNIETLRNLQKIFAANNKITDFTDIDKLLELGHLNEISLLNNPISRRAHYRITIVYRLRRIRILDLVDVTDEDRIKAEMYFTEQMQQQQLQQQIYFNGGVIQIAPGGSQAQQLVQVSQPPIQQQYTGSSNVVSVNHLDVPAYFQTLSSSPRLKPISLGESKYLSSGAQTTANNNSSSSNNSNSKKPLVSTKQQTFPARFRN